MARPKTPTNLLRLRGSDKVNPGRMKKRENEPQPEKGQGEPPAWLSPRGRRQYRKLSRITAAMNVLTISDHAALALLCDAYDDYWKAGEALQEHGITYKIKNREGIELLKVNPAASVKADAWRRVQTGLSKFGLDPSSRANLSVLTPEPANPFDEDPLPKTRMVFHKGKMIEKTFE